jgi:hypothetical protein
MGGEQRPDNQSQSFGRNDKNWSLHIFQIEQNLSVTLAGQVSDHIAEHSPTSRAESECFAHADAPAQIKDRNLPRLTDLVFQIAVIPPNCRDTPRPQGYVLQLRQEDVKKPPKTS